MAAGRPRSAVRDGRLLPARRRVRAEAGSRESHPAVRGRSLTPRGGWGAGSRRCWPRMARATGTPRGRGRPRGRAIGDSMSDEVHGPDGGRRTSRAATLGRCGRARTRRVPTRASPGADHVYSAAFGYEDVDTWVEAALGQPVRASSTRATPTPPSRRSEDKVRILEGAEAATSFSTGMAAISNTLFTLLAPGDRVVSVKDTYGGTNQMFVDFLPRIGVEVRLCDTPDFERDRGGRRRGSPGLPGVARPTRRSRCMDIARTRGRGP